MFSIVSRASLKSLRFAPSTATARGTPLASVSKLRLVPPLARSVGFGPVFFPAQGCLGHRTVHRKPGPVDSDELLVVSKGLHPGPLEDAGLGPFQEATVRRGARAYASGVEGVPLAAGAQYEQDCVHRVAIGHPRVVASEGMLLAFRQQRLDLRPQHIRNPPPIVSLDQAHASRTRLDGRRWKSSPHRSVADGPSWNTWNYPPTEMGSKRKPLQAIWTLARPSPSKAIRHKPIRRTVRGHQER